MKKLDLNITKIHALKIHKRKHDIGVKLVFSVNKQDDYYRHFLRETLTFAKPNFCLFKLEDYVQYLADDCEYDLSKDKVTYSFDKEVNGFSTLYLAPSPHGNLLRQSVEDLIEYKDAKLRLLPSGLFKYHEYLDNSNSVRGILKDLVRFKEGKRIGTTTTKECWLYTAIKSLDLHWN
jgi:hypothetical protein